LGSWVMDPPSPIAAGTTITMLLQRQAPPLQVTTENRDNLNLTTQAVQAERRPLPLGAEALTADFEVESPEQRHTYRTGGFGADDRLVINPLSAVDSNRLQQETTPEITGLVLDATTALTDTDVVLTTSPTEHTLVAEYGGKRVKFRRPIEATPPPEPRVSTGLPRFEGRQTGVQYIAKANRNTAIKKYLLETIQNRSYTFDTNDTDGNKSNLKSIWTLCHRSGSLPEVESRQTQIVITDVMLEDGILTLEVDFWQNNNRLGKGKFKLTGNQITFDKDCIEWSERGVQAYPDGSASFLASLGVGMTILHLDDETFIVQNAAEELFGFACLLE
ncbi:MAG: hypothetical protein ACRC9R_01920, partial [Enterovibrio sp.]